jgi:hypothetical protein
MQLFTSWRNSDGAADQLDDPGTAQTIWEILLQQQISLGILVQQQNMGDSVSAAD